MLTKNQINIFHIAFVAVFLIYLGLGIEQGNCPPPYVGTIMLWTAGLMALWHGKSLYARWNTDS